ncbi:MAG: cobalamin biosynthesis protein [Oscillospiraceae bacterium]|nr:cobalamin biosynthesis protein [Oscillospiraceae bacterium]
MKLAILAFTRAGCETARRIRAALSPEARIIVPEKFAAEGLETYAPPLRTLVETLFPQVEQLVFVGSCGIAVRTVAPFVCSKKTDPGVTVVDEKGSFVIPLLSGHIGGANALARSLAAMLGGTAVLTTATDVNHRFSVDEWAARQGLHISSMESAKAVAAAILERDIPLCCDFPLKTELPEGCYGGERGEIGIYIGIRRAEPFAETLRLVPPVVHLGLGCRRGTPQEKIDRAVDGVLEEMNIDPAAVCRVSSIDLKADEEGLLAFAREREIPVTFYTPETLRALSGDFTVSEFVRSVTGVDSVCERAAMVDADRLIRKKTAVDGVTVALAIKNWEAEF